MYWCYDCNEAFYEPHKGKEYMGVYPQGGYVEYSECPNCGSEDIDDALLCPNCGEFCGEIFGDGKKKTLCDACIQKLATEENLFAYGYEDKQSVEINGYLAGMLSKDEIERILQKELTSRKDYVLKIDKQRREEYIEDCKDNLAIYFTEMLQANK